MSFRCISATKRIQIIHYEAFAGKLSPSASQRRPSSEHDQVTHFRHVAKPTAGREAVPSHLRPRKQLTQYIRCRVNAQRPTAQAPLSLVTFESCPKHPVLRLPVHFFLHPPPARPPTPVLSLAPNSTFQHLNLPHHLMHGPPLCRPGPSHLHQPRRLGQPRLPRPRRRARRVVPPPPPPPPRAAPLPDLSPPGAWAGRARAG